MQNYTDNITYKSVNLKKEDMLEIKVPLYDRIIIEQEHPSYFDSTLEFNQIKYKYPYLPLYKIDEKINCGFKI